MLKMWLNVSLPVLVICSTLISSSCQEQQRHPSRFLIPEEYVGWVRIEYNVKNAAPLPLEDGYYLIKVPPSGLLKTSTLLEEGWAQDEYFFYHGENRSPIKKTRRGEGGIIWAGSIGSYQGTSAIEENFFVGTEEQLNTLSGKYKDESGNPKIGPLNLNSDHR